MLQLFRGLIVVAGYAISTAGSPAQEPDNQDTSQVSQPSQTTVSPAPETAPNRQENRQQNGQANRQEDRQANPELNAVQPPWGVTLDYVPETLRSHISSVLSGEGGVMVRGVVDGSPAQTAGIRPTDVLLKFNDRFVASPQQFESLLANNGSSPAQLQILQAGEQKQVTIEPESAGRQRVTGMRSQSDSQNRNSVEQAGTRGVDTDWEKLFQGGSTVFAFGGQTESGTVSLQGSGSGVTLNADYRDRRGKRRQLRMQGRPKDLDGNLQQLPNDLRELIRNQMNGKQSWDNWSPNDSLLNAD